MTVLMVKVSYMYCGMFGTKNPASPELKVEGEPLPVSMRM